MSRFVFRSAVGLAIGFGFSLTLLTPAYATIATHTGSNDPATEGWTANLGTGNTVQVAPDSTPSWQIIDASTSSNVNYLSTMVPADLPASTPWTQTVKLRVESSSAIASISTRVDDGVSAFQFHYFIGNDQGTGGTSTEGLYYFTSAGLASATPLVKLDVNSAFHTFDFSYDPGADGINISYDNTFQTFLARSAFFGSFSAGVPQQRFGNTAGGATADSRWAEVTLSVVPEPTSAVLLGMGGLMMLVTRKRARPVIVQ